MKVNELKKELKGLSTAELVEKENELKQELFNLRFQLATGQLEGTARIREVRNKLRVSRLHCVKKNCKNNHQQRRQ